LFASCRKNTDETTMISKGPIQGDNVEATVVGKVTDYNGLGLENAHVTVAGLTLTTNQEGLFIVKKRLLDNSGTLIRATKAGFFEGARFVFPHLNGESYIEIPLINKYTTAYLNAVDGGIVNIGLGATVEIPGNAIATATGAPYSGMVNASAIWLDPTYEQTFSLMPGDLRAIDAGGYAKLLKTYGMIGVELESPSGEKLNLLAGKTAKITFPLPVSIKSSAPSSIQLWHFNTGNGYWEESGTATLVNGAYEAEVSHFSFWNCDVPTNYAKLNMCFGDAGGAPLKGLKAEIRSQNFGTGYGYSDNNGLVSGFVPAGEVLTLVVKDRCDNTVYQSNVGPFYADADLGKIYISGLNPVTISGTLLNCNGAPVSNGFVSLSYQSDSTHIYAITNAAGEFTLSFVNCSSASTETFTGFDLDNFMQSNPQPVTLTGASTNVGNISVCSALDEYITFSCNGSLQTFILFPRFIKQSGDFGGFEASGPGLLGSSDTTLIYFGYKDLAGNQSSATLDYLHITCIENNTLQAYGCNYCIDPTCGCAPIDADPIVFTSFPNNVGEYAIGTVSGNVRSIPDLVLKPFTISFRIKRRN
jgi:hypothetical protein